MRARVLILVAALWPLFAPGAATSANLTPVGLWQAVDDKTQEPTGWFLISDHDGIYDGIIAKMFFKPGENPDMVCDQCKDDRQNHPWLGLEIIRGMKQEAEDKYGGGNILDPRDGNIYSAMMRVSPDGQTLTVRGYLGIALFGRDETWYRLPDNALAQLDPIVVAKYLPGAVKTPIAAWRHPERTAKSANAYR